ncbi:MAG: hypothetical protein EBU08_05880 [Micrococcales bacterium]|nr:hypothetical protein [Micrococcales bacterium]
MSEPRSLDSIVNEVINLSEVRSALDPVHCADDLKRVEKRIAYLEGLMENMTIERRSTFESI